MPARPRGDGSAAFRIAKARHDLIEALHAVEEHRFAHAAVWALMGVIHLRYVAHEGEFEGIVRRIGDERAAAKYRHPERHLAESERVGS
ncbi:MAG TPA: hypothetical protein VHM19_23360 [Polyangiales bacterium]|jgi:hypothetical protein|nr:hypothetical protein [Polyangiales bacterium]